jgi:hypothetical protein
VNQRASSEDEYEMASDGTGADRSPALNVSRVLYNAWARVAPVALNSRRGSAVLRSNVLSTTRTRFGFAVGLEMHAAVESRLTAKRLATLAGHDRF